jgi:hypothetical protein
MMELKSLAGLNFGGPGKFSLQMQKSLIGREDLLARSKAQEACSLLLKATGLDYLIPAILYGTRRCTRELLRI